MLRAITLERKIQDHVEGQVRTICDREDGNASFVQFIAGERCGINTSTLLETYDTPSQFRCPIFDERRAKKKFRKGRIFIFPVAATSQILSHFRSTYKLNQHLSKHISKQKRSLCWSMNKCM